MISSGIGREGILVCAQDNQARSKKRNMLIFITICCQRFLAFNSLSTG